MTLVVSIYHGVFNVTFLTLLVNTGKTTFVPLQQLFNTGLYHYHLNLVKFIVIMFFQITA